MAVKYKGLRDRKFEKKDCRFTGIGFRDTSVVLGFNGIPKNELERVSDELRNMGISEEVLFDTDEISLVRPDFFYVDEKEIRNILSEILKENNYELISGSNGKQE